MTLKGLIPGRQQSTHKEAAHWQFGVIENNCKTVDPLLHYGCFVLGFQRDDIVDYVCNEMKNKKPEIAESVLEYEKLRLNDATYQLSSTLYSMSNGYRSVFALSGSDANEGAVKLAAAYHHIKKNIKKTKIISFEGSYHGSTFLNYNMGDLLFKNPFYNLPKYSAIQRLPRSFDITHTDWSEVMAVVVETCSYGGNMESNSVEFWKKLQHLQQEHDVLIILDDIFVGGGKTGDYFGYHSIPLQPDIFTMGKAITAGYFPLSMMLYNEKLHEVLPKDFDWDHGFTYNFSLSGIYSALKYIDILQKEQTLSNFKQVQQQATECFKNNGVTILNTYGSMYMVQKGEYKNLYQMPLNANKEYFKILANDLSNL
jgi:adenosylmethionine-8-amino-7-oxononanoate aminotransferase